LQKNVKTVNQQCGRRIAGAYIIDTVHRLFAGDRQARITPSIKNGGHTMHTDRTVEEASGTSYHIRTFHNPQKRIRFADK
jgi:hypothetical protein